MTPGRPCLLAALAAVALLAVMAAEANAGTYTVRQCHNSAPVSRGHEGAATALPDPGAYKVRAEGNACGQAANDFALRIYPEGSALPGQYGRIDFTTPEGTYLQSVRAVAKLRREQGHRARLEIEDAAGARLAQFASGTTGPSGFEAYNWTKSGQTPPRRFVARLICETSDANCSINDGGALAKTFIRDLRFEVRDVVAPVATLELPEPSSGWARGIVAVQAEGSDTGSGVRTTRLTANGTQIATPIDNPCGALEGSTDVGRFAPCPASSVVNVSADTTVAPFSDGPNTVRFCATDYGTNPGETCNSTILRVDNTSPSVAFRNTRDPDRPEMISASATDATSGLSPGTAVIAYRRVGDSSWLDLPTDLSDDELEAEVNSSSVPPGDYEFRATIGDVAGNSRTTTLKSNGEPLVLEFPLKEPVSLSAELGNGDDRQLVPYRKEGTVTGRLLDGYGDPIAGEPISVIQTFDDGSLIDTRTVSATTNAHGRWRALLAGGPSRDVEAVYAGSERYQAEIEGGLDFDVRGKASLRVSSRKVRAGKRLVFRGRVKRHFARIPRGGKLVEIQARSGNDWITLQQAKGTDQKGVVKLTHRFRGFYTQPVTFTFRLKAREESGWPYRGPTTSKKQRVTVVPKR